MNFAKKYLRFIGLAVLFGFVGGAQFATAQAFKPSCELNRYQPEIVSWSPRIPSYFAKIHPDGKSAFFISGGNYKLELTENDEAIRALRIPDYVDAVPCPDGKILTTPGLKIYSMSEVFEKGQTAKPLLNDSSHSGVYQSCGVLRENGSTTTYRMVTDRSGGVSWRDYEITYPLERRPTDGNQADNTAAAPTVVPLGSAEYRCPGLNVKTIIISKTGKYLSGYFPADGTTKIISMESENACEVVLDLGYPTGKLEFNFDDTRVAFHMDHFGSQVGSYFSGVANNLSKDVFTLDLTEKNKKLVAGDFRRITTSLKKGSGSYYPSFAKDGRLMFINDDNNFYSFQVVNPDDIPPFSLNVPPPEGWPGGAAPNSVPPDWKERLHASAVVGSLWAENCSTDGDTITAVEASALLLNMPEDSCLSLILENWSEDKAQELSSHSRFSRDTRFDPALIAAMDVSDIKAVCAKIPQVQKHKTRFYGLKLLDKLDGPRAIHHYCTGCHVPGGALKLGSGASMPNYLDFERLSRWQIEESLIRIEAPAGMGRMPPAGFEAPHGGTDHKKTVKEFLECKLGEMDSSGRPPASSRCR